ncbi:MAG TPA: iron-sulfur cluster assembly scaffold protein [Xanthobacteraceae bacterium]|nr:iron-sulfur cluster assembly scaffold protein [Xanthobacteraceae bacterium]
MTAACREACCSVTPRFAVAELFERGFRRNRQEPLAVQGETIVDAEGNSARFSVQLDGGKIAELRFRASSCTTLIAYSEALAELLTGFDAAMAAQYAPQNLVAALPGVHPLKQNRAVLAVAALRAALLTAATHHTARPRESGDPALDSPHSAPNGERSLAYARE